MAMRTTSFAARSSKAEELMRTASVVFTMILASHPYLSAVLLVTAALTTDQVSIRPRAATIQPTVQHIMYFPAVGNVKVPALWVTSTDTTLVSHVTSVVVLVVILCWAALRMVIWGFEEIVNVGMVRFPAVLTVIIEVALLVIGLSVLCVE